MQITDFLNDALNKMGLTITAQQQRQFESYFSLLIQWNEKINLTRITDPEQVAIKHFADSLSVAKYFEIAQNAKVVDIGTGAGFPGIPLKIFRPDIELTLLDSLNKRLTFLQQVCTQLNINAQLVHTRAEQGGRDENLRESFDVVVSRAVARLAVLCEYCIPYVKVGGAFIAMKGAETDAEIQEAQNAVNLLGANVEKIEKFTLPDSSKRAIIVIRKLSPAPQKYPRSGVKIKNKSI